MVYNFALPPLVLHAFHTADASVLSRWAASLTSPDGFLKPVGFERTTFFNFLASHDGIALNPVRGILAPDDIDRLVEQVRQHGGLVSYRHEPDGSQTPYELNVNYFDALSDPASAEPPERAVNRFMVAQAIMLALAGVPGIYFHSLFGSRGWPEGARATGRARTINREKLARAALESELANLASRRAQVFGRFAALLRARRAPAFDPYGAQRVLDAGPAVFALLRETLGAEPVLCLHELAGRTQTVHLGASGWPGASGAHRAGVHDLISGRRVTPQAGGTLALGPYEVLWLRA
jgi:sucrose phosphorylase